MAPPPLALRQLEKLEGHLITTHRTAHVQPRELIAVEKIGGIRFLTIASTLTRGGTERAAMNYALGYRRAGYPSAFLAYGGGGPRVAPLQEAGVEVFVGGEDEATRARAIERAREWTPDILHLNRPGEADPISAAVLLELVHPRLRVLETNVFAYSDRSEARVLIDLHMHLSRWCLWKWSQSVERLEPRSPGMVVPYSVDCSAFGPLTTQERAAAREQWGIPPEAMVFGRVGQKSMAKWSPLLFSAFESVARQVPEAWLAVCGLPDELRDMIARLPSEIRSRLIELPMTSNDVELRRYYGVMDVFVHASQKGESFGLVLCESMLAGLPVITLNTPLRDNSQIEVVPHLKAGVVVNSLSELKAAMLMCKTTPAQLQAMGKQAAEWVHENYDIPVITRKLLDIAPIALAATSSGELARKLGEADLMTPAPGDLYRDSLAGAGVNLGVWEDLLVSWINRPASRRTIQILRAAQLRVRKLLSRNASRRM